MNNWFQIGIITKPQGVQGELRVLPTTDDPSRFSLLSEVFVKLPGGLQVTYKIKSARMHKNFVLLRFDGVTDRNAAEKLLRGTLHIPPEQALPLASDEYFVRDLIGLKVQTEYGVYLGTIKDVFPTGANDVYTIEDAEGKTFLIPAIKDVVLNVSLADGMMTIRLMYGLLELKS